MGGRVMINEKIKNNTWKGDMMDTSLESKYYDLTNNGHWAKKEHLKNYIDNTRRGNRFPMLIKKVDDWNDEMSFGCSRMDELIKKYELSDVSYLVAYILFMSNEECRTAWVDEFDKEQSDGHYQPSDLHDLALMPYFWEMDGGNVLGLERLTPYDKINFVDFYERWSGSKL
jgi:hypothetical protein